MKGTLFIDRDGVVFYSLPPASGLIGHAWQDGPQYRVSDAMTGAQTSRRQTKWVDSIEEALLQYIKHFVQGEVEWTFKVSEYWGE